MQLAGQFIVQNLLVAVMYLLVHCLYALKLLLLV